MMTAVGPEVGNAPKVLSQLLYNSQASMTGESISSLFRSTAVTLFVISICLANANALRNSAKEDLLIDKVNYLLRKIAI